MSKRITEIVDLGGGEQISRDYELPDAAVTQNKDGSFTPNPGGSGGFAAQLIASVVPLIDQALGADAYPNLTSVEASGTGVTLGDDQQSIALTAGVYDIAVAYTLLLETGDTGFVQVYLDGLSFLANGPGIDLNTLTGTSGQTVRNAVLLGLVVPADVTTKLNFEVDGIPAGHVWSITSAQLTIRKWS
jgi:hypothetical protein